MLERGRDVNSSSQVKNGGKHVLSALSHDLRNRDRVMLLNPLPCIWRKLPGLRRILPSLDDDHVKLSPELPCPDANTSNLAGNFPAQTQTRQILRGTSVLRRDDVVLCRGQDLLQSPQEAQKAKNVQNVFELLCFLWLKDY